MVSFDDLVTTGAPTRQQRSGLATNQLGQFYPELLLTLPLQDPRLEPEGSTYKIKL
jgi:hypothetical protein